jgi:manganese/zinc/iron transport system substrate-binding protein
MKTALRTVVALVSIAVVAAGCARVDADGGRAPVFEGEGPIRIVATIGMIGEAAERVGGERVEVTTLMGPGIDPHVYKATEGDVIDLADADLVLYNGLHLEAKLSDVLARIDRRTVAVTERMPDARLLSPPEFAGLHDPHVWFDVRLWTLAVERVRDALAELDPPHRAEYERNAERYLADLRELDEYVREQAARVPRERRVVITAHDAFNYFGRAYGFDVRGLQGISTASEAGTSDIQDLAEFIAERRIPAVFVESSVSPRAIEAVREAVRSRGWDVGIGEKLFSDAMGDPDTPEGTYVGMVRHNVDAIVSGLLAEEAE